MSRLHVQGERRPGRDWATLPLVTSTRRARPSLAVLLAVAFLLGLLIGLAA